MFIKAEIILHGSVWNLLNLPELCLRENLIAMAIKWLSVIMSNQQSKITDFTLGLPEYFMISQICLRQPNCGWNHSVDRALDCTLRNETTPSLILLLPSFSEYKNNLQTMSFSFKGFRQIPNTGSLWMRIRVYVFEEPQICTLGYVWLHFECKMNTMGRYEAAETFSR